jgi:hypothetical protein
MVGSVFVEYDAPSISMIYETTSKMIRETQVYIGYEQPTTIAPGQYTCLQGNDTLPCQRMLTEGNEAAFVRYDFSNTNGLPIYVVAHASVALCQ